ncbi:MAG: ABC transporter permease [Oligoflexia bacterium]|nr:ABC transporter permease [Oligoflexia bacterium]
MISFNRIKAMTKKEIHHITRDPFTLIMALIIPMVLVIIFGFAIDFYVKNIKMQIIDRDNSPTSRKMITTIKNSNHFLVNVSKSIGDPESLLKSESKKAVMIIEKDLHSQLIMNHSTNVQILIDGADNSAAGSMLSYFNGILSSLNKNSGSNINIIPKFLFNPELRSIDFTLPGLIVVVVAIISILLTSLTIAREWENGSMELLLSTPVKPIEIILGKIIPYLFIGLTSVALIFISSQLIFKVPFRGNILLFLCGCLLFISAYLAQGVLISVTTKKQQLSMQFAIISGLLPSLLLSGFIFPIENMPKFFQYFTAILPARWFMEISRNIFLKGAGILEMKTAFAALLILNFILILAATKKFKRSLE